SPQTTHAAISTATAKTYTTYTVTSGETVSGIAAADGTTVAEIVDLNHLANANDIVVGQKLILPRPIPITTGATGTGSTGSTGAITSSPGPGGFGNGGNGIAHPEMNENL
ncbi:MAG: LysM peptidoglycan-binding domain-containing protein, partial [Sulfobacillus sp.]